MIDKCLRGLMPRLSAIRNHKFLSFASRQTFSVVNHQTFGYIFNSDDDAIMTRINNINQIFAKR